MHSVLAAAHQAAPEESRPTAPPHGGVDANPQLASFGYCGVAQLIAESMSDDVAPKERKRFDGWLKQATDLYQRHALAQGALVKRGTKWQRRVLTKPQMLELRELLMHGTDTITPTPGLSIALSAANIALLAAYDIEMVAGGSGTTTAVRNVAALVVQALPKPKITSFLEALDRRLLREELRALLVHRDDPTAATVNSCVWRAAAGKTRGGRATGAQVSHWLGILDDGQFILVWKVGARWQISKGARDEILATVPNEHMASAVRVVNG